jgi:hypothetical protein
MSQSTTLPRPNGKIRSPWGVWWLSYLTLGIYYFVWYVKLNKELARAAGPDVQVQTFGLWFSQCVPIAYWISLAHTTERLNTAQHRNGTAPIGSAGMAILGTFWFISQTRYLQRRANALWLFMQHQQTGPVPSVGGYAAPTALPSHSEPPASQSLRPAELPTEAPGTSSE